jgi:hypothetical protein
MLSKGLEFDYSEMPSIQLVFAPFERSLLNLVDQVAFNLSDIDSSIILLLKITLSVISVYLDFLFIYFF